MAEQVGTPAAGAASGAAQSTGARAFDLQRFGMEVANEIGVNPGNLGAYGLTESTIRQYESATHSGTQNGGSSR